MTNPYNSLFFDHTAGMNQQQRPSASSRLPYRPVASLHQRPSMPNLQPVFTPGTGSTATSVLGETDARIRENQIMVLKRQLSYLQDTLGDLENRSVPQQAPQQPPQPTAPRNLFDATDAFPQTAFFDFGNPVGNSMAENFQPSVRATTTKRDTQRLCLIGDFDSSLKPVPVCHDCSILLGQEQKGKTTDTKKNPCRLCLIKEDKPEAYTVPFCDFLTNNPTIFHAVDYFKTKLVESGFKELPSSEEWSGKIVPGGKYWTTRNGSAIIAFTVGESYKPGNGVAMIAGHIDAVTAKLKPVSQKPNKAGFIQLGVAPYAGGFNPTWWDRDLSIGGRVIVRDPETNKTAIKLVRLDWPIARVPTLAPHFGVGIMGSNNKETQAVPIIGLDNSDLSGSSTPTAPLGPANSFISKQPPKLVKLIAKELEITDASQIVNWELELYDSQPAQTGGMDHEFIFGGRIDDKLCSWAAFHGLLTAENKAEDSTIKLVALFDDEEIGSLLRQGARGNFLPLVIERTVESLSAAKGTSYGPGIMGQTYAKSFLVSADVTHAANPNFLAEHLTDHTARLNVGVTICADANGHMTTDAVSTSVLTRVGELANCATQTFMIRNDSRSGGTVGPALSSAMGVKSADAGLPQLSMHSVRATTGSLDPGLGVKFFRGFLDNWEQIYGEWH